jgi:L-aminopeptidase/D-esterase-like protein
LAPVTLPVMVWVPQVIELDQLVSSPITTARTPHYALAFAAVAVGTDREPEAIVRVRHLRTDRVIERKAAGHDMMRRAMAAAMVRARETRAETKIPYIPTHKARLPAWLTCAA